MPGPTLPISEHLHSTKYRGEHESYRDGANRICDTLKDTEEHRIALKDITYDMRYLFAGRMQAAVGSARATTPYNCFVSPTIPDSMNGIMDIAKQAARTMQLGGGIGYDFSTIRPRGSRIVTLNSSASGPVSFMGIYNATCITISSAGHRRGAQMGVLRIDHPDIEEFIRAKQNGTELKAFNLSVGITDEFMHAVENDTDFSLVFEKREYSRVNARKLWDELMRSTYDWAEPGVLFIDRINELNNLWYCETIAATNPCGEQPLPPYGACLLGSFNLAKYVAQTQKGFKFDWSLFKEDIPHIVRATDNIIDAALYPLPEQGEEAYNKRRMGLGITGLANAGEALGFPYGSKSFVDFEIKILKTLRDEAYTASALLAKEKGAFPLFDVDNYMQGAFIKKLPNRVKALIKEYGIRNSHLTSIAPTGTISLTADNISSGIEPVFAKSYTRTITTFDSTYDTVVEDYGFRVFGVEPKTTENLTVDNHLNVLLAAQEYVDSAVSKTCNVPTDIAWDDFKNIYMIAWLGGAKGCTTYRKGGMRDGILNELSTDDVQACHIDEYGNKSCDE